VQTYRNGPTLISLVADVDELAGCDRHGLSRFQGRAQHLFQGHDTGIPEGLFTVEVAQKADPGARTSEGLDDFEGLVGGGECVLEAGEAAGEGHGGCLSNGLVAGCHYRRG